VILLLAQDTSSSQHDTGIPQLTLGIYTCSGNETVGVWTVSTGLYERIHMELQEYAVYLHDSTSSTAGVTIERGQQER
jgi:hypothetical protein